MLVSDTMGWWGPFLLSEDHHPLGALSWSCHVLMVLSKPSSKGCAMSPAVHLSPQLVQALPSPELCLIRVHLLMSAATKVSV